MRKGEQTRQEIIHKAAPIFNQKGYDGAALFPISCERLGSRTTESTVTSRANRNSQSEPLSMPSTTPGNLRWILASKEQRASTIQ